MTFRRAWPFYLPALLLYTVLTGILAAPLVAALFHSGVPGWEGDNLYYVRSMWWMKRALVDLHIAPFLDPTSYVPVGHVIARSEMTVTNTILGLPVTLVAGPVVAYDVMLLFSFVGTGLFTHLWVHRLTGHRSAGLVAGTIVAFLPFRFAHLPGHLPQLTTQWIPLTLYAFELFLERRSVGRAAFLGVSAALVAVGCWYYGYSLALLFPLYVVIRTWRNAALWRDPLWWTGIAVSGGVALVVMGPFLYQMLRLSGSGAIRRPITEMQSWALNFYDPFLPNLKHPLWGDALERWFPKQRALWPEKIHSLGFVAMGAGLTGLLAWRRRRPLVIAALAAVWLASYSISLGPVMQSGDRQVRVPVPQAVARAAASLVRTPLMRDSILNQGLPIPLPSLFLYKFVPMTSGMRVMARFSVWTALATAALAGFGVVTIVAAAERRIGAAARVAVPALLIALIAFESWSEIPTMRLGPRAVDLWLADQPDAVVIVELPVDQGTRSFQNYWSIENRRRNLFGWSGDSFPPPVLFERMAALGRFPEASSIAYLKASAATYVLLTPSQIKDWDRMERLVSAEPGLQYVQTFNDVRVYRVVRNLEP
jgi:hypothetical protein